MILRRILGQLIDLIIGFSILIGTFAYILPFLSDYISNKTLLAILGLIIIILANYLIQLAFMMNNQTLGKAFMGLKLISTDEIRKDLSVSIIIQREVLCKLISCFFMCIPVLVGKNGGHEEATRTAVMGK